MKFVSIPNGMEFYGWDLKYLGDFLAVSIPNGMEFYSNRLDSSASEYSGFNSQRDGILP